MAEQFGNKGRYDELAERALDETEATAVVVLVVNGKKGHGFSCSCDPSVAAHLHRSIPDLSRAVADDIERKPGPDGVRVSTKGEPC